MVASGPSISPIDTCARPPSSAKKYFFSPSGVATTFCTFAAWLPAACRNASLLLIALVTSSAHSSDRNFTLIVGFPSRPVPDRVSRDRRRRSTRGSPPGPLLLPGPKGPAERDHVVDHPHPPSSQGLNRRRERSPLDVGGHPALVPSEDLGDLGHPHQVGNDFDHQGPRPDPGCVAHLSKTCFLRPSGEGELIGRGMPSPIRILPDRHGHVRRHMTASYMWKATNLTVAISERTFYPHEYDAVE